MNRSIDISMSQWGDRWRWRAYIYRVEGGAAIQQAESGGDAATAHEAWAALTAWLAERQFGGKP